MTGGEGNEGGGGEAKSYDLKKAWSIQYYLITFLRKSHNINHEIQ
jgi:hypothetical protein